MGAPQTGAWACASLAPREGPAPHTPGSSVGEPQAVPSVGGGSERHEIMVVLCERERERERGGLFEATSGGRVPRVVLSASHGR